MSEQEQKRIFSQNLKYYIANQDRNQKEIADAIGVSPQTFNTWYQGIALPRMGKIELLVQYFGIRKSDLLEERVLENRYSTESAQLLIQVKNNPVLMRLCEDFMQLDPAQQETVANLVHSMNPGKRL